jgi:hypothetical protein
MSAFIVEPATVARIAWHAERERRENPGYFNHAFPVMGQSLREAGPQPLGLAFALWRLNFRAVNQRYEERARITTKLRAELGLAVGAPADTGNKYQTLKSIHCWAYQCAEGTVTNSKLRREVERMGYDLAESLVDETEGYKAATWG